MQAMIDWICVISPLFTLCASVWCLQGTRGVLWEHELYEGFTYNQDRTFFHSFQGDVSSLAPVR